MRDSNRSSWTVALAGALVAAACSGAPDMPPPDDPAPVDCSPAGDAHGAYQPPPYLARHPGMAEVRIIDLAGESRARELLARSLQGVVNRQRVRVYIVDDVDSMFQATPYAREAHQHWLSVYSDQKLLTVGPKGTLDDALKVYAGELEGYYLASEAELWSINAATTAIATRSAVIATAETAPALEKLGLHQLDSFVGRWPDGVSCYKELADKVGKLPHPGFAILANPQSRMHDFLIQQGVLTIGGYQTMPEWDGVKKALSLMPPRVPIYGYPARDGGEELHAISDVSQAGDVLIASDSTPNISLHAAATPKTLARPPAAPGQSLDCDAAQLNVVLGFSDGDNLIIPLMHYPTSRYWLSPDRGRIPLAWSISGALATVAPAAYDYYARTLAPGDELVEMIGPGYAYGSKMPNADWFYGVAFAQLASQGTRVLWLFDPSEMGTGTYSWQARAAQAVACGKATGLLDGYYPGFFGSPPPDETVGTVPITHANGGYSDTPAEIADRIRAMLAMDRGDRPRVAFFSAAAWSNDIPGLVKTMVPLEQQGVRFLNASTAMKCVRR